MEFKDVVAVSGKGGLFEMIHQRPDGMLIRAFGETKKRFVSNRIHTFSPLDKIGIYTEDGDSLPLEEVMQNIHKDVTEGGDLPKSKASSADLKDFFRRVMPDYDDERVYVSDIKKVVKWYKLLVEHDLIQIKEEEETTEGETEATENEEETTEGEAEAIENEENTDEITENTEA